MDKILSIYGTELPDPTSSYAQKVKKYREDSSTRDEKLIELISKIEQLKVFTNGFYLYLHKTKPENIQSIVTKGLELRWGALHGIESTLERVFDSKSEHREENLNYLSNSVANGNNFGDSGVLVLMPHDYEERPLDIMEDGENYPFVKNKFIIATFEHGKITNVNLPQFKEYIMSLKNQENELTL